MNESLRQAVTGNDERLVDHLRRNLERARLALIAYRVETLCAAILFAMALNMIFVTARKSITADELVLIPAAYYNLITDDPQLVREHPPLSKLLAGIPLLFIQPDEPAPNQMDPTHTRAEREWFYAMRFWEDNRARFETIFFWSRVPMIALTLVFGLLVFVFARDLFGPRAALFAIAMFAMEPTILAHSRVVQTDVVAAFGLLLMVFALHRYLRAPSRKLAAGVGAAAGVAMLTKFSMAIVGPALLVVFIVLLWRARAERSTIARHGLIGAVALILVINAGYFFRHRPVTNVDVQWITQSFPTSNANVLASVRVLRVVLPTDFLIGTYWQLHHSRNGHAAGLLGMYSRKGWWYYFPVAFALKTTIPFLLVALISLVWAAYCVIRKRESRLLFLVVPFVLYTVFLMMSPINIGVRYYLPAYGFLFILGGALFDRLLQAKKSRRAQLATVTALVLTVSWMSWEAVRTYPNYMPYMNQLASRHPHWWYLSDSNVEWGEEVKELAEYLKAKGETRTRALLLAGYITLGFYGVEYLDALSPTHRSSARYLALGASFLNGSTVSEYQVDGKFVSEEVRVNTFAEFRNREPEAIFGNSIYLYRLGD